MSDRSGGQAGTVGITRVSRDEPGPGGPIQVGPPAWTRR